MNIKTIDLIAKTWLDRPNSNSYFSAQLTINYAMKDEKTIFIPWELGPNDAYKYAAVKALVEQKLIPSSYDGRALWKVCEEQQIILRCTKHEKQTKKDVKEFGDSSSWRYKE
jgi:hypothetical protein